MAHLSTCCGISLDSPRKKISRHKYRKQEIMTNGCMSNKETKKTCIQQDRIYHHDNIEITPDWNTHRQISISPLHHVYTQSLLVLSLSAMQLK
jgi:hypothetical protein